MFLQSFLMIGFLFLKVFWLLHARIFFSRTEIFFTFSPFCQRFLFGMTDRRSLKKTFLGPLSRRFRRIRKCFKMRPSGPTKELVPPKEEKPKELASRRKEQIPPKDIAERSQFPPTPKKKRKKKTTRRTESLPKKVVNKKTQLRRWRLPIKPSRLLRKQQRKTSHLKKRQKSRQTRRPIVQWLRILPTCIVKILETFDGYAHLL